MNNIIATTYVALPVGTCIELYTNTRLREGQIFKIHHINTKKVVHKARVTGIEDRSRSTPQPLLVFLVRAVVIK